MSTVLYKVLLSIFLLRFILSVCHIRHRLLIQESRNSKFLFVWGHKFLFPRHVYFKCHVIKGKGNNLDNRLLRQIFKRTHTQQTD